MARTRLQGVALTVALVASFEAMVELHAQWDHLAVTAGRPLSAPAWSVGWWEHVRQPGQELALLTVSDGAALVGVLPMFSQRRGYAPLGLGLISVEPLAAPGREREVAAAFAAALEGMTPRPRTILVEAQDDAPSWSELLAAAWPTGHRPGRGEVRSSPSSRVELGELDFDRWFAAKSANFRRDIRRKGRRLELEGGVMRLATTGSLAADVESFLRLHLHRHPKGSKLADDGVAAMLCRAGAELLPLGRFRLAIMEVDGEPEAALLVSSAGSRASAWASGMDERLARHSPVMQLFVADIRGMAARGETTMDLGPGEYDYKARLASVTGCIAVETLIPPGHGELRSRGAYRIGRGVHGVRSTIRKGARAAVRALRRDGRGGASV
jgi:CelD/BcsL family acetyltransferase involved in cellulose biosynthesis